MASVPVSNKEVQGSVGLKGNLDKMLSHSWQSAWWLMVWSCLAWDAGVCCFGLVIVSVDGFCRLIESDASKKQDIQEVLATELGSSDHQQGRAHWKHLNAMNEVIAPTEPGGIVHFVLEEDAGHVVRHEVFRMVRVVVGHQEELPDGHGAQGQHGGTKFLQRFSLQDLAPQLDSIPQHPAGVVC